MAQIYCDNHKVKQFYLLPNLNAKAKYKKQFYGKLYKNNIKQKNADALVMLKDKSIRLVEFKEVISKEQVIPNINKAHQQADNAVLLFKENLTNENIDYLTRKLNKFINESDISSFECYKNTGETFFTHIKKRKES